MIWYVRIAAVVASIVALAAWRLGTLSDRYFSDYTEFIATDAAPIIVAHAGGATEDGRYSNSLEAIEASYAAGIRWFEVDLAMTADKEVVLLHDWHQSWSYWFDEPVPATAGDFERTAMRGGNTPLSLHSFCRWLGDHPDADVFLQFRDAEALEPASASCPEHSAQMIAFVHNPATIEAARHLGFSRLALNTSAGRLDINGILAFAKTGAADFIVMWNAAYGVEEMRSVAALAPVVVPTVNDPDEAAALHAAGITAIMSDVLRPPRTQAFNR